MEEMKKCPLCGEINKHAFWYDDIGIVEEHYLCEQCGYFEDMLYQEYHNGVCFSKSKIDWIERFNLNDE